MNSILKTVELMAALAKIAFYGACVYIALLSAAFFLKNIY